MPPRVSPRWVSCRRVRRVIRLRRGRRGLRRRRGCRGCGPRQTGSRPPLEGQLPQAGSVPADRVAVLRPWATACSTTAWDGADAHRQRRPLCGRDSLGSRARSLRARFQRSRSTPNHEVLERVQFAPVALLRAPRESGVDASRLPPQSWPPACSSLAHMRVRAAMSSSSRGSTKYFLTDSSKLRLAVSAKCRPLSVKLMSDTRPSPWSAPRRRCPASMRSWTNRDALVGLTLTSSPDRSRID